MLEQFFKNIPKKWDVLLETTLLRLHSERMSENIRFLMSIYFLTTYQVSPIKPPHIAVEYILW